VDGQGFDRLTRRLAGTIGRRGALRSLVGVAGLAVAGSAAVRSRAQDACPEGCGRNRRCVDGACVRACQGDGDCRDGDDACIGGRCRDGVCSQFAARCEAGYVCCGNGECCGQSCRLDLDCFVADPCVTGRCADGTCEFTRREPCVVCAADADCAETGGTCCGDACISPCPEGSVLSKGCECRVTALDGVIIAGNAATDDASGADGERDVPPTPQPTAPPEPTVAPTAVPVSGTPAA
jgi:hypothetical protein